MFILRKSCYLLKWVGLPSMQPIQYYEDDDFVWLIDDSGDED